MVQDPNPSSFGLAPNVAAGLAALFGWLGGLIILLGKPPQQWVRFVAVQSIVLSVAILAAYFVLVIVGVVLGILFAVIHAGFIGGIIGLILGLVDFVLIIAYFVAILITTIQGFQGKAMRLPVVAQYADRWATASTAL